MLARLRALWETRWLPLSLGVVALLCLAGIFWFDRPVAYYFRHWEHAAIKLECKSITHWGKSQLYLQGSALALAGLIPLYYAGRRLAWTWVVPYAGLWIRRAAFLFLAVGLSGMAGLVLKVFFGRARPNFFLDDGIYRMGWFEFQQRWQAFPSGHAITSLAAAAALAFMFPLFRHAFLLAGIALALTRVVITSHFLSDFVFGSYVGFLGAVLLKSYFDRKGWSLTPSVPVEPVKESAPKVNAGALAVGACEK